MPVTVKLSDLAPLPGTRGMWPTEFREFVDAIERDPEDRASWGAAADWCDEIDEPVLAAGFRFVHKHRNVVATKKAGNWGHWELTELPGWLSAGWTAITHVRDGGLVKLVAELGQRLYDIKSAMGDLA